jgi:hypothetical protein
LAGALGPQATSNDEITRIERTTIDARFILISPPV